jgi:hypothetical protein
MRCETRKMVQHPLLERASSLPCSLSLIVCVFGLRKCLMAVAVHEGADRGTRNVYQGIKRPTKGVKRPKDVQSAGQSEGGTGAEKQRSLEMLWWHLLRVRMACCKLRKTKCWKRHTGYSGAVNPEDVRVHIYIQTHTHHAHNHAASITRLRLAYPLTLAFGWRIHCGVEVTKSSTNKQHTLSTKGVKRALTHHQQRPLIRFGESRSEQTSAVLRPQVPAERHFACTRVREKANGHGRTSNKESRTVKCFTCHMRRRIHVI